jgi:hypothetical protein
MRYLLLVLFILCSSCHLEKGVERHYIISHQDELESPLQADDDH